MLTSKQIRITTALVLSLGIHASLVGTDFNVGSGSSLAPKKYRRVTMTLAARRMTPPVAAIKKNDILVLPVKQEKHTAPAIPDSLQKQVSDKPVVTSRQLTQVDVVVQEIPKPQEALMTAEQSTPEHTISQQETGLEQENLLQEMGSTESSSESYEAKPTLLPVLQAQPLYKKNPPPRYPSQARRRRHQGTVHIEVLVNTAGRVSDLKVQTSSGYGSLDKAALAAVRKWHFEPGTRGSQKIEMWVRVPVRFELR